MAKQLNFEHNGKEYTLEFTRESVKQMEREGFVANDIITKPMLTLPKLFAGAFRAHHRFDVKQKEIEQIFGLFKNKGALIEKLAEMYSEPMETLMDDTDEGNAIAWDANF
jgi:predicted metallopeptidase